METHSKDSPTHRMHVLQVSLNDFLTWVTQLQARRNAVVEKITRAKLSNTLTIAATKHKNLDRVMKKLDRLLHSLQEDTTSIEDELNKARLMFFELSGGEVLIANTEILDGVDESARRRTVDEVHAHRPANDQLDLWNDGTLANTARSNDAVRV